MQLLLAILYSVFASLGFVLNGLAFYLLNKRRDASALDEIFRWFTIAVGLAGIPFGLEGTHYFITGHYIHMNVSNK